MVAILATCMIFPRMTSFIENSRWRPDLLKACIGSCSSLCESVSAIFLQLGVKLLLLSMDCTCKGNASKVLRDRCGVTQGILSRSRERERRFVTQSSECAGSCRREMASAIVLEAVLIYCAVTRKLYEANSQKRLRSQRMTRRSLEVPLLIALNVVVSSARTVIQRSLRCSFQRSIAKRAVNVSCKLICTFSRLG